MKSIKEIRRENFVRAIEERASGNQTEAAARLEYSTPSLVSRYATGKKDIGSQAARRMEQVFGLPKNWMDADHSHAPGHPREAGDVPDVWPFPRIPPHRFLALTKSQRDGIEDWLLQQLTAYLGAENPKSNVSDRAA